MFRGQFYKEIIPASKDSKTLIGGYGKGSVINYSIQNRLGNEKIGVSKKHVVDIGVVTAQTGIQHNQGPGVSVGGRASVITSRGTYCFDVNGWQVELGMNVSILSAGFEYGFGALPDGGYGIRCGTSTGLFGAGYLIRISP